MNNLQKQKQLKHLGYYLGELDGLFGHQSIEATKKFQSAYGLDVDGSFGPLTEQKSIDVWKDIQTKLNAKNTIQIAVDGYVGNETINAIKTFQSNNGLEVDAYVGPLTLAKLNETTQTHSWEDFPNFQRWEFRCPCGKCGGYPVEPDFRLVKVLQQIRNHFNKPLNITSGIRCQTFNDSLVGSTKNSAHTKGKASDFYVQGVNTKTLLAYCQELKKQGIIAYTYTNNTNMAGAVHINI